MKSRQHCSAARAVASCGQWRSSSLCVGGWRQCHRCEHLLHAIPFTRGQVLRGRRPAARSRRNCACSYACCRCKTMLALHRVDVPAVLHDTGDLQLQRSLKSFPRADSNVGAGACRHSPQVSGAGGARPNCAAAAHALIDPDIHYH